MYDGGADDTSESLPGTINHKIIPRRSANVTMPYAGINVERAGLFDGTRGEQIAGRFTLEQCSIPVDQPAGRRRTFPMDRSIGHRARPT
ncbi:hypothetical protein ACWD6R_37335, partial [Streptomyces sp. NPDC005151]